MRLNDFVEVIKIEKGWSNEKKYKVVDKNGQTYLLRISPTENYENKKAEYENMEMVSALGIPMCQPIEFGICDDGVYSIQSWIDGKDAEEAIINLSDKQVYEAGTILRKLHSIPAPDEIGCWEDFFNRKMNRKIENYNNCPLKYEGGEALIIYIEEHRHLLKGRPMTYQHGDYHIGNLMIDNKGKLVVIDFNRNEYGDPWEEFNRIVWCAQSAPLFATGMIDGYFNGDIPKTFWDLLALYISSNTLSSLPWAIPFGQKEIDVMINLANSILDWYDGMKNTIPKWYRDRHYKKVSDTV